MTTDRPEWKQRAEDFLISYLNANNENAEEASVYFLSRGEKFKAVSDTMSTSIERWKHDKTNWSEECRRNPARAASTLRLMQWGDIGALQKYRDSIYQNFGVPYSHDFYPSSDSRGGYLSKTSAFFPLLFPLFTSDIAINQMGSKLLSLLLLWQNHLNDLFMRKELFRHSIEEDERPSQTYATLISAYIFAAYRLNKSGINQTILDKSIQYLLDHQHSSGLWAYDQTAPDSEEDDCDGYCLGEFLNSRKHVILAAIGILALYLANSPGTKISIEKAAYWLLQHQQANGGWYQYGNPKYPFQVHTTVLILDALELAGGGTQVTFSLPENKIQSKETLPIQNELGNVIIQAKGSIYLQKSSEDKDNIPINDFTLEDFKENIKHAEHKLLNDKINLEIYKEYFIFERQKEKNPNTKIFSMDKLTKTLKENGIIPEDYTSEAIRKRFKKLIAENLVSDIFAEKRRQAREKTMDDEYWEEK